jgi:hypothetical protein
MPKRAICTGGLVVAPRQFHPLRNGLAGLRSQLRAQGATVERDEQVNELCHLFQFDRDRPVRQRMKEFERCLRQLGPLFSWLAG